MSTVLVIVVIVVAALILLVSTRPSEFRISRSGTISAPPAAVFPHVNDLRKWEAWSPWAKLDPNAKSTFEGPAAGVGAVFGWAGNKEVGEGRMTILESRPDELVRIKLEFFKPFKATNTAEFIFKLEDGRTVVTWSMFGTNNFMAKAINLVINCDRMVGGQFERGLANLRAVAEGTQHGKT
jgi:uncharacterized protein YndB with AHSA1/START domain